MNTTFLKSWLASLLAVFALQASAQQKASEIPVETFLKRPENQNMVLSPNGELLAAVTPYQGRGNLVVVDLKKRSKTTITSFKDYDVVEFRWVNNKRIFFRVADGKDALGRIEFAGTYAIDVDGGDARDLNRLVYGSTPTALERRPAIVPYRAIKDSDEMYVGMTQRRREAFDVYVLNTRTGRHRLAVEDAPVDTTNWILDWNNVPRIAESVDVSTPKQVYWYRDDAKSPWRKLTEFPAVVEGEHFEPIAFAEDNKTLYVSSNIGRDRAAIYKYDPQAGKMGELVFEHPLLDLTGGLQFDRNTGKLLGIRYNADKPGSLWLDDDLNKLQKQVDATLPKTDNVLARSSENPKRLLVFSSSDVDAGRYYLLSLEPLAMEEIMSTRPWLKPELMSPVKYMPYKARDGLQIPAWVTIPKESSGKNLPLVVHVHGGPWVRVYGWNSGWTRYSENQFFASRGYVVLEPEPRSSTGFGAKLLTAGYRQWGQAMQDDLTDGVMELVKQGIVDKNKVCIYGGSYGGYASLWGPIKDPDLYKCAIPWIAVSDLVLLQTATWSDTNSTRMNWAPSMKAQIGSARDEREMLEKVSPYLHADRIKIPMLIAMGEDDRRVPIDHGERMHKALLTAGVKHDYVIYPGEAHGFNKDDNVYDFFRRVEKFLAENLK
jgi:dipeptidyl aminopeptidase/acylaminoacyl peptidase